MKTKIIRKSSKLGKIKDSNKPLMWHKCHVIPAEEVHKDRSTAYSYLSFN